MGSASEGAVGGWLAIHANFQVPGVVMHKFWLVLFCSLCCVTAHAETVATVASPGNILNVALELHEGRLSYRIDRFGEPVIDSSRLGFQLRNAEKLERNLALGPKAKRRVGAPCARPRGESC